MFDRSIKNNILTDLNNSVVSTYKKLTDTINQTVNVMLYKL